MYFKLLRIGCGHILVGLRFDHRNYKRKCWKTKARYKLNAKSLPMLDRLLIYFRTGYCVNPLLLAPHPLLPTCTPVSEGLLTCIFQINSLKRKPDTLIISEEQT